MNKKEVVRLYLETSDPSEFFKNKKKLFGIHYLLNPKNIKRTNLIKCFKKELRCLEENPKESLYLFCKKEDRIASNNFSSTKVLANQFVIFNFSNNKMYVYGNEKLFFTTFKKHIKEILKDTSKKSFEKEDTFIKEDFRSTDFIKNLLEKRENFYIYEILFNSLDLFNKKIRAQFSSDQKNFDIIELLSKEEIKRYFIENLKLGSLKSISFKNSIGEQETLQFKNVGYRKIEIVWKRKKESYLKKSLCEIFGLYENITLVYEENVSLSTLFKEITLDFYKRDKLYKNILEDYKSLIYLDQNKSPKLNKKEILKALKDLLKEYKFEKVKTTKYNRLRFPKLRGKQQSENLIVIKKNNQILTYLYLGESELYQDKENFLREFFIFMPCMILDFRSNKNEDYYISLSQFLENLNKKEKNYFVDIINKNPKNFISSVESQFFQDIFKTINLDLLPNFEKYNKKLGSQQKGELYEKVIFFLFSILFHIERLGGSKKHDGNIFVHNNLKIGYDAKNLENNVLSSFTDKKGKFKDIGYIKNNNLEYYFFIFKKINESFFNSLKTNIKNDLPKIYLKAIDINYILNLFNNITKEGLIEFSRVNKQNMIEDWLREEDGIIK